MRVKSVSIRNYRSLKDVTIRLDGLTTIIEPNGSGKTSVLRALELFSNDAPPVTLHDFNDEGEGIEVVLALPADGADEELAPYAVGGEIRLRRMYEPSDPEKPAARPAQKNHILTKLNSDFDKLRGMTNKTEIIPVIAALKEREIYAGLPECESAARVWTPLLLEYERKFCLEHPDHPSVRPGYSTWNTELLPPERFLDVVYVPAMRDIARDAAAGSGSYLGKLVNMAIDYERERDTDVGRAARASVSAHGKYFEMVRDRLVPKLNDDLRTKSRRFAKGATVTIRIGRLDGSLPTLSPSIVLDEGNGAGDEGAEGTDIEHVGGGLQRIYLIALLETIADQGSEGGAPTSRARLVMIDEPELYQHPQRQKVLREALRALSEKNLRQVVYSTHSPHFVTLKVPMSVRKVWQAPSGVRICNGAGLAGAQVRGRVISAMEEAVFANGVILVDGHTDEVILDAIFRGVTHRVDGKDQSVMETLIKKEVVVAECGGSPMSQPFATC